MANEEKKQQVVDILSPFYYMGTIREGYPRMRPMGLVKLINGRLYSGMIPTKDVYKEICADPHMEFCGMGKGGWVRVRGTAVWEEDPAVIDEIEGILRAEMEKAPGKFGKNPPPEEAALTERPPTKYFYLDNCVAEIRIGSNVEIFEF